MSNQNPEYDDFPDYTEGLLPDDVVDLDQYNEAATETELEAPTLAASPYVDPENLYLAGGKATVSAGYPVISGSQPVVAGVSPEYLVEAPPDVPAPDYGEPSYATGDYAAGVATEYVAAGAPGYVTEAAPGDVTALVAEVPVAAEVVEVAAPVGVAVPEAVGAEYPDITWKDAFGEITSGSPAIGIGALVLSLLAGSLMIAFTNAAVRTAIGYFFARPSDTFRALGTALVNAYGNLIRGAFFNWQATGFTNQIMPLMNTLANAAPLIVAGLAVALAFKAGLFNIGGRGQMIMGAIGAGWLAITLRDSLSFWPLLIVCVIAGALAGAIWGAIAGWLKAAVGAHEVISTIMLNFVAFYLLQYLLATQGLLQAPGTANPISAPTAGAAFPHLFGPQFPVRWSLILAFVAVLFVWWLLNRSSLGFGFRAVGENARAARVAGINVSGATVGVMALSGALCGLAGVFQVLGTITTGFTDGIDAGIGFDAITVALLGGSSPIGVLLAGLLFGAFKAGGSNMQAGAGIPVEIVTIIQSLIVLFIAAPPLVCKIFRLRDPRKLADARRARLEAAQLAYANRVGITERVAVQ